ncbi:hypothetical protein AM305_03840 [Actinobacillus minor NM305]|uniref:Uncharacterized protein n=1 Tax=Actinobacillus minor NM305 TaxID=637911 RepID=C5S574_9PAST|nr:hypothetical protein AM305_03840 [Actinobacillus minor NM305]
MRGLLLDEPLERSSLLMQKMDAEGENIRQLM